MNEPTSPKSPLAAEWWTTADVLAYLAAEGKPLARTTWTSYVSRGYAPKPESKIGNMPLWRASAVRTWYASRS